MEDQENKSANEELHANSEKINEWNDRLDENLESEATGDEVADEKARKYSEEHGSGDQSDESLIEENNPKTS